MKRKRREGEVVCRCGAYRFPHRMLGGNCTGIWLVSDTFELHAWGDCRHCALREHDEQAGSLICRVLDGGEPARECEALQEYIAYEGIKLYGVNAPPKRRMGFHRG